MKRLPKLTDHIEHFQRRVLQDAIAEATSSYWMRRAEAFWAVGTLKCDEIAEACLAAAAVAIIQDTEPVRPPDRVLVCRFCDTPTSPWSCSCGATRVEDVA